MQNSLELGRTICFSIHPVDDYQHWRSCFETYIAVYDGPNRGTMTLKDGSPVVLRGLDVHGAPMQQGAVQHIMDPADLQAFRNLLASPGVAKTAVMGRADLRLARAFCLNARSVLGPPETAGMPVQVGDIVSLSVMRVADFERFRACVAAWAVAELPNLPGLKSLTIACSGQLPGTAGEAATLVVLKDTAAMQAYMSVWLGRVSTVGALRRAGVQLNGSRMFNLLCTDCEAARNERKAQAQAMWRRPAQPVDEQEMIHAAGAQEGDQQGQDGEEQEQQQQQQHEEGEEDWRNAAAPATTPSAPAAARVSSPPAAATAGGRQAERHATAKLGLQPIQQMPSAEKMSPEGALVVGQPPASLAHVQQGLQTLAVQAAAG